MIGPLVLLCALWLPQQQAVRPASSVVRGMVVDAGTRAPIADARVQLVELSRDAHTTRDGRFEFHDLAPGTYTLTVSTVGYIFVHRDVEVPAGAVVDLEVPLAEGTGTYQAKVTVTADTASAPVAGVSSQSELGSAAIQALRGVAADDPMRAVQALPGVATGDDFQAQFSVRGSEFRHVGLVLDDVTTPLLLHAVRGADDTGSVAMINSDVLDHATLLAGPHPERHGDWLGATLDFGVREGSRDRTMLRAAVSGTSASTVVEGPIGSGGPDARGSWLVSVRKSYIDWLIRKIVPGIDSTVDFTDLQSKIGYDLTRRQHLQVLVVDGGATLAIQRPSPTNGLANAHSRGGLASLGWQYRRESALFSQRVSFVTSDFHNTGRSNQELGVGTTQSITWRADATWLAGPRWTVEGGLRSEWQRNRETLEHYVQAGGGRLRLDRSAQARDRTNLSSLWGQASRRTAASGVTFGARATTDSRSGRTVASPWLLTEHAVGVFTLRASASLAHQFPDLEDQPIVTGRTAERSAAADASVEQRLGQRIRWQVTGFVRRDTNVMRPLGEAHLVGTQIVPDATFVSFANALNGQTRGVDLTLLRSGASGLTGWVAYTFAHTRYRDRITGEAFDGDFDQRHTLNVFLEQRLSYRTAVIVKFRYGSNFPVVGYFRGTPDALRLAGVRNQVRLPPYARLDLRANRTYTFDRRRLTFFAEIMNVLNRRNDGQSAGFIRASTLEAVGYVTRMIPFVPSVGMLLEF